MLIVRVTEAVNEKKRNMNVSLNQHAAEKLLYHFFCTYNWQAQQTEDSVPEIGIVSSETLIYNYTVINYKLPKE